MKRSSITWLFCLNTQAVPVPRGLLALSLAAVLLGAFACSSTESDDDNLVTDAPESQVSPAELAEAAHLSEGDEFFPLFVARALRTKDPAGNLVPVLSDRLFSMAGALPDPTSPSGLPMGFSDGIMPDLGVRGIGLNCMACHTTKWNYTNKANQTREVFVIGSGGMVSTDMIVGSLLGALRAELNPAAPVEPTADFIARVREEGAREPEGAAKAFAAFQIFAAVLQAAGSPDGAPGGARAFARQLAPQGTPRQQALIAGRYHWYRATLTTQQGAVPSGFGRSPSFAITRNRYFYDVPGGPVPRTGPVRVPNIFHMEHQLWNHNGVVNSILERNIDQVLSTGGVYDWKDENPSLESSARLENLHRIEQIMTKASAPSWPADAPFDARSARRGKEIFLTNCASCHEPEAAGHGLYDPRMYPAEEIGTDMTNMLPFANPPHGIPGVAEFGGEKIQALRERWYATHSANGEPLSSGGQPVDAVTRAAWEDSERRGEAQFRSPPTGPGAKVVAAKSLGGSWATAPYLRNGSVPTLMDLLTDEDARPKIFYTGHHVYDMNRVGIQVVTEADPSINATFKYDATTLGNSNRGHSGEKFGTTLSDADKGALVEYLKTKTSYVEEAKR